MAYKLSNQLITAYLSTLQVAPKPGIKIAGFLGSVPYSNPDDPQGLYLSERGDRYDYFSDTILLFGPEFRAYIATVIPGAYYTENPTNPDGAAHLIPIDDPDCPGNKPWLFKVGLHHGKYKCLVQAENFAVHRDKDRNGFIDSAEPEVFTGDFGIHIHHAGQFTGPRIGMWSAGCQVLEHMDAWNDFFPTVQRYAQATYPYYLFDSAKFVKWMEANPQA